MKATLLTLAFAVLAFIPQVFAMNHGDHAEKMAAPAPAATAVIFFSESCGSCKILDPVMKEAMQAINTDKVDVVKFDFTNKDTIAATRTLASEKNVEATLQKYGAKTGFVVLLDAAGNEVDIVKVDDNATDIAVKLVKAITTKS